VGSQVFTNSLSRYNASGFDDRIKTAEPFGVSLMRGKSFRTEGKIGKLARWAKDNWQVLIFWLACAFAGWYLGARGYGMEIYFRITGINPQEWTPLLRLTSERDPKVGSKVSLNDLVDWAGKPLKLPQSGKIIGLLFICGQCGIEEKLAVFYNFASRHHENMRLIIVYIGHPNHELMVFWRTFKEAIWARDPKLSAFERLNALYMPRFYLIAPDGTLKYISPIVGYLWSTDKWQQELKRIEKVLGRWSK
jgi:hypothetical protein